MVNKGLLGTGIFLFFIGALGFLVPINDFGHSTVDLHNLCTSNLGQLGQMFGGRQAIENCQTAKGLTYLAIALSLIGIILIIVGVVVRTKKPSGYLRCEYCGYYCDNEKERLNHYLTCEKKKNYDSKNAQS